MTPDTWDYWSTVHAIQTLRGDREILTAARSLEQFSRCRRGVGVILTRGGIPFSFAVNRPPVPFLSCADRGGCILVNGHCVNTVHAEIWAITSLPYLDPAPRDLVLYCSASVPCLDCCKVILASSAIARVVSPPSRLYLDEKSAALGYPDRADYLRRGGVEVVILDEVATPPVE